MDINKHNYEAYFLDYHEGNLSAQEVAELLLFVEQHPELRESFESFESITLDEPTPLKADFKRLLKKEITSENIDEYLIGSSEGILNSAEEELLSSYLEQHPQYLSSLDLYKRSKINADPSLIYEGKEDLKRFVTAEDELLISALEGQLSTAEMALFRQQLLADASLSANFQAFQQTVLKPEMTTVYFGKDDLKRKERKVIPLFYMVGIAAAILVLFGLFFLFNSGPAEQKMAENPSSIEPNTHNPQKEQAPIKELQSLPMAVESTVKQAKPKKASIVKHSQKSSPIQLPAPSFSSNEKQNAPAPMLPQPSPVEQTPAPLVVAESKPQVNVPATQHSYLNNESAPSNEYLSLAQAAVKKLKESTLDPSSLAEQRQADRLKKFNGWDLLQLVAKGMSKLTGKDVEVNPTYNEKGEVIAYAMNAGKLGFTRER